MDMMEEELQQAEADYMDYSNYLKEYVKFGLLPIVNANKS